MDGGGLYGARYTVRCRQFTVDDEHEAGFRHSGLREGTTLALPDGRSCVVCFAATEAPFAAGDCVLALTQSSKV